MASWTALAMALVAATPIAAPPLAPAPAPSIAPPPARRIGPIQSGAAPANRLPAQRLRINGQAQSASWEWIGDHPERPDQLWLPLEVLQGQLGFSSRTASDGSLELEWFGHKLLVPSSRQRTLGDEVAIEVAALLESVGVSLRHGPHGLELNLPRPQLLQVRSSQQPGQRRVVLDLAGPATVSQGEGGLRLQIQSGPEQLSQLLTLGLPGDQRGGSLRIRSTAPLRVFTLGEPTRIVIDLPSGGERTVATAGPAPLDPRLQALLGSQLVWDRQQIQVAGHWLRLNAVRLDPRRAPLQLRTLSRPGGMEGLSSLSQLAGSRDALVAINGGYFNRVRRLPLGALKDQGRWLSGPILNRGVMAWEANSLPRFGRLQLEEWLEDGAGGRWPLQTLNSGYVQRGLSRYTADWGPSYRALSDGESALVLRDGAVQRRYDAINLRTGVPLVPSELLVVARGGFPLPVATSSRFTLTSRPSNPLGEASNVVGGGPLLLQDGRVVLAGGSESFGPAFLSQGAPRTVVGSDGQRLWLMTLEGTDDAGPTLTETALALQQLGLRDALNLDGGSSTGLVLGGNQFVKGRGVIGAIHNGLGLVPLAPVPQAGGGS